MLRIKYTLFVVFGLTSFIMFYMGLLNYLTSKDQFMGALMLIFAAIVSGSSLVTTVFVSNSITKPIEKLTKIMTDFSKSNKITDKNTIITNVKEIFELNENFHSMAKTIQNTIEMEMEYIEKLKEIDRQKDEFSSMISHELKTPLVPILGYVQMLKKEKILGTLNSKQLDAVDEIHTSATKLQKLIGDILTAQKLGIGKFAINQEEINTSQLLDSITKSFYPIFEKKSIKFIKTDSLNIIIQSDKDRILQIFSNLIKNALNFVSKESGIIEIGAIDNENLVKFFVRDNGIGISEKNQKDIFKKFYQIDTSNRRKREGSGLGLAICKGIVEKLGGRIWVESTLQKGSVFYFTIPKIPLEVNVK